MAKHPQTTKHPVEKSLSYLYGVVLVDNEVAGNGDETGLCFFADQ